MTRKAGRLLSAGLIATFGLAGASTAWASCTVFEHANYQGWSKSIGGGAAWKYIGGAHNDKASSIKVARGCKMVTFEHRDYQGRSRTFSTNTSFVGSDFNDIISSAKCSCAVVLEGGGSVEQIVERTLRSILQARRGAFEVQAKQQLGRADMLAKGFTFYNINPRLGELHFQRTGPKSFKVSLTGNHLYFKSTQPSVLGSYADPAFEVNFDAELYLTASEPNATRPLRIKSAVVNTPRITVKGRNIVGNVAVMVGNFYKNTGAGKRKLDELLANVVWRDVTRDINNALGRIGS